MSNPEPIQSDHSTEWHWEKFAEFCRLKAEVKEPSPHMQMIGLLTEEANSVEETVWFTGLYANFYNIPSALVMWKEWPLEKALRQRDDIKKWLGLEWSGLTTRTERRAVRTVSKMNECLLSYLDWMQNNLPMALALNVDAIGNDIAYDLIWKDAEQKLRFMGRYIIIRLLEGLHRFAGLQPHLYDIRSIGGWSPKRCLGLLYPEHLELLLSPDTRENVRRVDDIAYATMERFATEFGTPMSPYVFAAMLCEYRVAYEKHHQYPGWTIDQEPAHWYKIRDYWLNNRGQTFVDQVEAKFFGTRMALFPSECLGELHNWEGTRVEPRKTLRDHSYNWTDLRYDFEATTDFSQPVRR